MSDTPDDVVCTSLTADQVDILRPHGRVIEYAKGDVLFVEGDTNLDLSILREGEFVVRRIDVPTRIQPST